MNQTNKDIKFALAVLRKEYNERRKLLVDSELNPRDKDNTLAGLESILSAKVKIQCKFDIEED